ncbi:MAG: tRNA (adenosine(37)-N6)-threonylcarbamoyltransferase complex dimerization subunit type 1 TsaB [Candidatus Omnitrophota bacterium]|nr:tRNA (adenosine(37)-N6)-threonylcarbamoyltransferase complex dimerization subunit type 1 TsaB [Candidatus Omnitrophota bacterium]
MNLLAIDTSTDYMSLAVLKNGMAASRFHKKCPMRHSSMLLPMIDKMLGKAGIKIKDIDCFCISIGPGSFTGLRIGSATVKGLAYALKKPIVAIPTLDVIAENARPFKGIICPVIDARKSKVYACLYKSDGRSVTRLSKYLLIPPEELLKKTGKYDKIIFLGDAVHMINNFRGQIRCRKSGWHPKAEVAAGLGMEYIKNKKFTRPEDLEPLYLYSRKCDITGH